MPNEETASKPNNVVKFVNPAEVVRRVEYAYQQLKALAELGIIQGPCASVVTALAAIFGGIQSGSPAEEVMQVLDKLTGFLTSLAQDFTGLQELQEQIDDQTDQIASLMRQVQEFENLQDQAVGFEQAAGKPFVDSQLIEQAITARCRWREEVMAQQDELTPQALALDELIRPLDQKAQWAEGQELALIKAERNQHTSELEKISAQILRLTMVRERYTQQITRLEKYLTACKVVEAELQEDLISLDKPEFFPEPPKEQDKTKAAPSQPYDGDEADGSNFVHITPLTEITGAVNARRVQLERLAEALKVPSETVLMVTLYELIPPGYRGLRSRGTKTLLNRADKAGILKEFGFFTPDQLLSNWRGTLEAVEFLERYLNKGGFVKGTYLHSRNGKFLPWKGLDLFTAKEAAMFLFLDEEDRKK